PFAGAAEGHHARGLLPPPRARGADRRTRMRRGRGRLRAPELRHAAPAAGRSAGAHGHGDHRPARTAAPVDTLFPVTPPGWRSAWIRRTGRGCGSGPRRRSGAASAATTGDGPDIDPRTPCVGWPNAGRSCVGRGRDSWSGAGASLAFAAEAAPTNGGTGRAPRL